MKLQEYLQFSRRTDSRHHRTEKKNHLKHFKLVWFNEISIAKIETLSSYKFSTQIKLF